MNWEPYVDVDIRLDGSVFDAGSAVWDWARDSAFGGDDGPSGHVEVPTGTTTTSDPSTARTTTPKAQPPRPDPAEHGPQAGTVPTLTSTVPGG